MAVINNKKERIEYMESHLKNGYPDPDVLEDICPVLTSKPELAALLDSIKPVLKGGWSDEIVDALGILLKTCKGIL